MNATNKYHTIEETNQNDFVMSTRNPLIHRWITMHKNKWSLLLRAFVRNPFPMSTTQNQNISTFASLSFNHDMIVNRRVSDHFSSSRSYAPECKFSDVSVLFVLVSLHWANNKRSLTIPQRVDHVKNRSTRIVSHTLVLIIYSTSYRRFMLTDMYISHDCCVPSILLRTSTRKINEIQRRCSLWQM
jgi:hypothetical protein